MYRYMILSVFLSYLLNSVNGGCCFPNQWSANLVETTGEYNRDVDAASLAYSSRDYFYDFTGKQIAYRENKDNVTGHTNSKIWTIYKYDKGKKYTIISNTCSTDDLSVKIESPCIPDDATSFGTHSYPAGIEAAVWFIPDHVVGGSRRLSVTKDDCMPLSMSVITGGPDYILRSSVYQNVTDSITDPTVFDVPAICNQGSRLSDVLYVHKP